jgi:hypothetical protein
MLGCNCVSLQISGAVFVFRMNGSDTYKILHIFMSKLICNSQQFMYIFHEVYLCNKLT